MEPVPAPILRIQAADFDVAAEIDRLSQARADVGAIVTFTGICRAEEGRLAALELEHYPGMAEAEIGRIAGEAVRRWELSGLTVIHRIGLVKPGQNIVLVAAGSVHRQAAFEAASFVMDFLKSRAPFWKREHLNDGTTGDWVEARDADEDRIRGWAVTKD
ncbi:molybdopterin synthase catalytic subunit [Chelativorans sp. ZYF759]|uniref:molybdenum cofactor biosynthesis protein MoaE n=1 Tax=Chelativorans sp. ZYF759 TaxID=2692213 RepID=UPI00145EAEF2|nr:molybdenum cofactor biosynthesis protein MoaE [Chelativorans sp. ZYF759]NMG38724.1 molybdopterin synthase catalytic subunit [Chelativorans sp. ZYF759]